MATSTLGLNHGVMEGKGAYNRNARIPAGGAALALPLLEEAAQKLELGGGDEPVVVADYGSSQGKNSLGPMQAVIRTLRGRVGSKRAILVFHIDQPTNDFNTLFEVLDADPDKYTFDQPNVFPCAIGRSFYENVLPPEQVHLAWSSYAAVWLSRIPSQIPGHIISLPSTGTVRASFERQAAEDWKAFLTLRACELRPGGRLVVVLPALDDHGHSGLSKLFDLANAALGDMVDGKEIDAEERERMVLGSYPRQRCELLAPFQTEVQFQGLTVEHCDLSPLPDSAWADYERDGNEDALAGKHALLFRSIFAPSLALSLTAGHDADQRRIFAERLETRLRRRLSQEPVRLDSFVEIFVARKAISAASPVSRPTS
jgi:SAM dependent carboxyl methyltransferase